MYKELLLSQRTQFSPTNPVGKSSFQQMGYYCKSKTMKYKEWDQWDQWDQWDVIVHETR